MISHQGVLSEAVPQLHVLQKDCLGILVRCASLKPMEIPVMWFMGNLQLYILDLSLPPHINLTIKRSEGRSRYSKPV